MHRTSLKPSLTIFVFAIFLLSSLYSLVALASHGGNTPRITIIKDTNPADNTNFTFTTNALGYFFKWGSLGNGNGQFAYPQSIAADESGNIYVADGTNNRVQVFDSNGNFITKWGSSGSGNGQFNQMSGVAVGASGNVYVTDLNNDRVQVFDSSGSYLFQWGSTGTGAGQFDGTGEVDVDTVGNVYVADKENNRIQLFDSSGNFLRMWGWGVDTGAAAFEICTTSTLPCQSGIQGSENGQFNYPAAVDIDQYGNVYVVDIGNDRIEVFDNSGNFLGKWGSTGSGAGELNIPRGVEVDEIGNVYVVEQTNNRVQVFDNNGAFLYMWGGGVDTGAAVFEVCSSSSLPCQAGIDSYGDGQFSFPLDMVIGPAGTIYVTGSAVPRIQVFSGRKFLLDDAEPDDDDSITNSITFELLSSNAYTFTEMYNDNWELMDITCDSGSWSADIPTRTLTVTLGATDDVTCTFTNSPAVDEPGEMYIPIVRRE